MRGFIGITVLFLIAVWVLGGCATGGGDPQGFTKVSYQGLEGAANVYEAGFGALAEMHRKGLISDQDRDKAIGIGNKYWAAYHAAVDALIAYERTRTAEDQAKINIALAEVSRMAGELLAYVRAFQEE